MTHDTFFKEDGSPSFVLIYKMLKFTSALAARIRAPKDFGHRLVLGSPIPTPDSPQDDCQCH